MLWPLVALGVEAASAGGRVIRAFVARQLPELSRYAGTYSPLVAKDVLEAFWDSGKPRWDECLDKSFVFTTQIAVDVSKWLSTFTVARFQDKDEVTKLAYFIHYSKL